MSELLSRLLLREEDAVTVGEAATELSEEFAREGMGERERRHLANEGRRATQTLLSRGMVHIAMRVADAWLQRGCFDAMVDCYTHGIAAMDYVVADAAYAAMMAAPGKIPYPPPPTLESIIRFIEKGKQSIDRPSQTKVSENIFEKLFDRRSASDGDAAAARARLDAGVDCHANSFSLHEHRSR